MHHLGIIEWNVCFFPTPHSQYKGKIQKFYPFKVTQISRWTDVTHDVAKDWNWWPIKWCSNMFLLVWQVKYVRDTPFAVQVLKEVSNATVVCSKFKGQIQFSTVYVVHGFGNSGMENKTIKMGEGVDVLQSMEKRLLIKS